MNVTRTCNEVYTPVPADGIAAHDDRRARPIL